MDKIWIKVHFTRKNGMMYGSYNALVLSKDQFNALNHVRKVYPDIIESNAVNYATTIPSVTADFCTNQNGNESNIDYIMVDETE